MLNLDYLLVGILNVIQPVTFLLVVAGVFGGILIAAIPGLTATMAIALLIPFTFALEPGQAISVLAVIYLAQAYGGAITSILIKVPGTPDNAMTVLDGYPLAQQGQAGKALGVAIAASALGGIFGVIILVLFAPPLAKLALRFGPAEFFALAVFGLSVVASLVGKSIVKGLVAVVLGLFIATIGLDPITGYARFTFGIPVLRDGIHFIPLLIGLFAVSEIFRTMGTRMRELPPVKSVALKLPSLREIKALWKTILRSSGIGTFIGILPGTGSTIAAVVAYGEAVRWSKEPQKFGTGVLEGIAAPESANNAACAGAMIPTLTLGIPGGAATAVMLGAFMIHGLRPGPFLFVHHADVVYTIFVAMFITNFLMLGMGIYGAKLFARVILVPFGILAPIVLILASIGTFAIRGSAMDMVVMFGAGIVGYIMMNHGFPLAPTVLGVILGPIAESGLRRAMIITGGNFIPLLAKPIVLVFLSLALLSIVSAIVREKFTGRQKR